MLPQQKLRAVCVATTPVSDTDVRYTYYREQCRFCGAERLLLAVPLKQRRRAMAATALPSRRRYFQHLLITRIRFVRTIRARLRRANDNSKRPASVGPSGKNERPVRAGAGCVGRDNSNF